MLIRTEAPADMLPIDSLLKEAFETDAEAKLVQVLRENSRITLSLVACTDEGEIIGHLLFSPVTLEGEDHGWQGLAPLAVKPQYQRQGIGKALIREAMCTLPELGYPVCVVLGDDKYYQASGFTTAAAHGLRCQWEVPEPAFMVVEMLPGALADKAGLVEYCPEFSEL